MLPRQPRILTLPSGLRLPCVEQGDGDGLPVVMLHGVTDSWRSYLPVLPLLPPSLRAIAVTQRGHRGADRPASGYRLDDLATDALGVLDALGLESAVLVGHSMGASVAQRVAAAHPERVRGLLLMGAFHSLGRIPAVHELWEAVMGLGDPVDPDFVRGFQSSTAARPIAAEFLDAVVADSLTLPARVWQALFGGFLQDVGNTPLERITAPTVILWGARDTISPRADQHALARAIPGAKLVVVPDAGHALHWEDPTVAAEALAAFAPTAWPRGDATAH